MLKKDRVRKWKIGAFLGRSRVCEVLEFAEKRTERKYAVKVINNSKMERMEMD